jgi:hypothetical protein
VSSPPSSRQSSSTIESLELPSLPSKSNRRG